LFQLVPVPIISAAMGRGGPNRGARADRRSGGVKKDQFVKHGRQEQIPQEYEKIRGTKLQRQGDSWVRVVGATGKVFAPNDLHGAHNHIDKIAAQGNDYGEQQQHQRRRGRGSEEQKGKGSGKGEREAQKGKGSGKGEQKGRNSGRGNRGDARVHEQYEKVKGTQIRRLDNGEIVRYVPETGKSFQPNDLKTVYEHLDRLGASQAKAPWREQEREQSQPGGRKKTGGGKKNSKGDMYPQYEKVQGTQIREMDGEVVRFVRESGRTFQPNDLRGVYDHIDKLQRQPGSGKGKGKKGGGAMMALPGPSPKGSGKGNSGKGSRNKGRNTSPAPARVKKQFLKQERDREGREPRQRKGRFADKVARKQQEQRGRKERTPEQLEAMKEKRAEQHAAKCEKDGRKVLSDVWHTGEIVRRMNAFALAKPLDTFAIPLEVRNKLEISNEKRRSSQKEGGSKRQRNVDGDDDDDLIYLACADIAEEGVHGKGFRPPSKVQFKLYTDDKGGVGGCEIKSA